jgi:glycosyltransferase involved in cell wall biosynthesis
VSTTWVPPDNQYLSRLHENDVTVVQLPKWLSRPASHWPTKEKILTFLMKLSTPLIYLLGSGLFVLKRRSWKQSRTSVHNWLRRQMSRFVTPDRRKPLARLLLDWWLLLWRPHLVHIHGYTDTLLFVIEWAHQRTLPMVYVENQTPDVQFDWWKDFQQVVNKVDVVIAPSEKSAKALRTICGVTQPIAVFNPNVVDPMASGWKRNDKPRQNDETLNVTTVARLYVTKGLTYLLETVVQVKATHPATQFRVYGDGPLREELLAYAEQLGLDGHQIFVGAFTRQELPAIMDQTDIFAVSSILEGQPLAVVEAMAYGCPIVTTTAGGIDEMIEDGVNGLVCQPRDPECLAQKIRVLIEDPALREKLGRAARQSYEEGPFQPAAVCDCFISIYQKALQQEHLQEAS